jgi:ribosomal protein L12E/L44/L45/RPP1/RPP2
MGMMGLSFVDCRRRSCLVNAATGSRYQYEFRETRFRASDPREEEEEDEEDEEEEDEEDDASVPLAPCL